MEWISEAFMAGVDFDIDGNGGPHCVRFVSMQRRIWETILIIIVSTCLWYYGYRRCDIFQEVLPPPRFGGYDTLFKRVIFAALCLIFGIELGFKFATKTMIFLLNPCHVVTIMQIFFIVAKPSRTLAFWFRIHIHLLLGAFLALLFPVVNTRFLHFEVVTYWLQHVLIIFVVPPYLMYLGGVYTVESLKDMSYACMGSALFFLYNTVFLQFAGIITQANLNANVCPAISDPFAGPNYKVYAVVYMTVAHTLFGKLMTIIYFLFIPRDKKSVHD